MGLRENILFWLVCKAIKLLLMAYWYIHRSVHHSILIKRLLLEGHRIHIPDTTRMMHT